MSLKQHKISVVGCGKLGACMAASFAAAGGEVIAIDQDQRKVDKINARQAPVFELGLQHLFDIEPAIKLTATTDYAAAAQTDITFFIVPTPSNPDGSFSNRHLLCAIECVAAAVKAANKSNHLFVVSSTTTPGSLNASVIPTIETILGPLPFRFCYNPEFIALGNVLWGLLNPDFVLIGERDEASGDKLSDFYKDFMSSYAPIHRMSVVSAELTKVAVNAYVTTKISFANFIGMLAEKIGADYQDVLQAAGHDRRINPRYFAANGAYGGPCLPRDNRLLQYVAANAGVPSPISGATDLVNEYVKQSVVERVQQVAPPGSEVVVAGVGYKPGSFITEESTGEYAANALRKLGYTVYTYDPYATLPTFPFVQNVDDIGDVPVVILCHPFTLKLNHRVRIVKP